MRQRDPRDNPRLTEEERAWLVHQYESGQVPELPPEPSRSRVGRFFDAIERVVSAGGTRHWR